MCLALGDSLLAGSRFCMIGPLTKGLGVITIAIVRAIQANRR
jgi:hypothetical protein